MRRLVFATLLALMLTSWGCAGYHRSYSSSYSPGCYSCGRTREYHRQERHGGGRGHHHRDHDHDDGHHRRH